MFGYIRPCVNGLTQEEKERYRSVYCGICRSLGERYGQISRFAVNFDMTFLALLLTSLYEPEERAGMYRCLPHPVKPHRVCSGEAIDYAADMTVALSYYKCMDDWQDERSCAGRAFASALRGHYEAVSRRWPEQCARISASIGRLNEIERQGMERPGEAVDCAGELLSCVFAWKKDYWTRQLEWLGDSLGRFVYLTDAAVDLERDRKKGLLNPLAAMGVQPENARELLIQQLSGASEAFEGLPLIGDAGLMRNILYSGVWQGYNQKYLKAEEQTHGKRSV